MKEFDLKRQSFGGPEGSFPFEANIVILIIAYILQLFRQVYFGGYELLSGEGACLFLHVTCGECHRPGGIRCLGCHLETLHRQATEWPLKEYSGLSGNPDVAQGAPFYVE